MKIVPVTPNEVIRTKQGSSVVLVCGLYFLASFISHPQQRQNCQNTLNSNQTSKHNHKVHKDHKHTLNAQNY